MFVAVAVMKLFTAVPVEASQTCSRALVALVAMGDAARVFVSSKSKVASRWGFSSVLV